MVCIGLVTMTRQKSLVLICDALIVVAFSPATAMMLAAAGSCCRLFAPIHPPEGEVVICLAYCYYDISPFYGTFSFYQACRVLYLQGKFLDMRLFVYF